jgi:hypothetical protein
MIRGHLSRFGRDHVRDTASISLGVGLKSYMLSGKQTEEAMGMMIIRHKVRDYGQWRPIFDGHVEMQRAAGRVYHSADSDKSEIVVVFDTTDTKMAKDFAASADLKEAMIKAGVLDTPTIYFLESID